MSAFGLVVAAAVSVLPGEYHLNCANWEGKAVADLDVRITARDGTTKTFSIRLQPAAQAVQARDLILFQFDCTGWQVRADPPAFVIIEGFKGKRVRSIELSSKEWKPAVSWVPRLDAK